MTREQFESLRVISKENFPRNFNPNARVEVVYAEYVLARWKLEGRRWNAYHSGLVFRIVGDESTSNNDLTFNVEFVPRRTSALNFILLPTNAHQQSSSSSSAGLPLFLETLREWYHADYKALTWENEGGVIIHAGVPSKYTNFTSLGFTSGAVLEKYRRWMLDDYGEKMRTFDPIQLVYSNGTLAMRSMICHDLVHDSLKKLGALGFTAQPVKPIFRDHVVVVVRTVDRVDPLEPRHARRLNLYYRYLASCMERINKEFADLRHFLLHGTVLDIRPYAFKQGGYYTWEMAAPYINYCYRRMVVDPNGEEPPFAFVSLEDEETEGTGKGGGGDPGTLCALGARTSAHSSPMTDPGAIASALVALSPGFIREHGLVAALEHRASLPLFFFFFFLLLFCFLSGVGWRSRSGSGRR